jgi:hypothetical protein
MSVETQQILEAIRDLEKRMDMRFAEHDSRFDKIDRILESIHERMNNFELRLVAVERGLHELKMIVFEMRDDLTGALKAIDLQAEMLLDHGRRIVRLEKRLT